MMLQLNDNGEFTSVNEEDLVYVDKKELDELFERYEELEKENKQLKEHISILELKLDEHNIRLEPSDFE